MMSDFKPFANVTHTERDNQGNAMLTASVGRGILPTVEEAKAEGVDFAASRYLGAHLWWKPFSTTTWGLMADGRYTYVLVSWCAPEAGGVR